MRGFLLVRIVVMWVWAAAIVGAFLLGGVVRDHLGSNVLTTVLQTALLAGVVLLGLWVQRTLLARIDPDQALRASIRGNRE